MGGRNGLATSASSNCYFRCQRVGRPNQISDRCHMTTVNRIASCVETSQSCPFITIVDRSITLVQVLCTTTFARLSSACVLSQNLGKKLRPRAGKDHSQLVKISEVSRGLHCLNEVCNCCDVTSVNSLNSRQLPGRPQNGLGTRLVVTRPLYLAQFLNRFNFQPAFVYFPLFCLLCCFRGMVSLHLLSHTAQPILHAVSYICPVMINDHALF